jgi:hypothetical protein
MGKIRNAHNISFLTHERRDYLEELGVDGRIIQNVILNMILGNVMDLRGSGQGPMTG